MSLSWADASEIVCGKVIKGEYSPNAVRPDIFFPPYCDIIKAIKAGTTEIEELIEIIGLSPVQAALESIKDINGLGEANWISLLEKTYAAYDAGQKLEKFGRKLQRGEEVDWSIVKQYEDRALQGVGGDFTPLSKVVAKEMPFIRSGWDAIDQHLQGLPEVGVVVVGGDPGVGKSQPLYSKILTPDGWKTMGETRIGDTVIGGDGEQCKVLGVFPQGNRPIYRVWFDDETHTDCDEEHLWLTQSRIERRFKKGATVKSLKEIMESGLYKEAKRKNHSIEFVDPIKFNKKELQLSPYLMGILLAEGGFTNTSIHISSGDNEVLESVKSLLPEGDELIYIAKYDCRIVKTNRKRNKIGSKTMEAIRFYGLDKLRSHEKFIPKDYLLSSIEDRTQLLCGILDGDGTATNHGYIEYSTTSEQLKDGFIDLCRGLGGRVTWGSRSGQYTVNQEVREAKKNYRVWVKFRKDIIPFSLPRKKDALINNRGNQHHKKFIKKVEYLGEIPAQCIYVDNEDHLYVTDDYIVTHNTTFMAKIVQKFATLHTEKKVAVFSIEMVLSELAMRFNEIGKIPETVRDRILLNDFPVSADELVNKAATIENLGLICVDFVDMMIRENSEAEYSKAYLTLANASKRLHCPIIVIAQLVKYSGGLPKKKHLRYSRMAEAFPSMILMLYDPSTAWSSDEDKEDTVLPIVAGRAYVLCWKVRGGFRNHLDESPGAIQMAFRGDKGWAGDGKNSRWFSLKKES